MRPRSWIAAITALAGLGVGFVLLAQGRNDTETVDNRAFLDATTSNTVSAEVSQAVQAAFTIDPRRVAATTRQAHAWLTGTAVQRYDQLYGPILKTASKQGLALTTTVRATGLTWLHPDQARLLVMADQTAQTAAGSHRTGAAQLSVVAELVDGTWRIADFTLL